MRHVLAVLMHDVDAGETKLRIARSVQRRHAGERSANRQRGEDQFHEIDLQWLHAKVQIARAHHDLWPLLHEACDAGCKYPAAAAVVRVERDVRRAEAKPLEGARELRAPCEDSLSWNLESGRELLEQTRRDAREGHVPVVKKAGIGN